MLTKLNLLKLVKKFSKSLSLSIADKKCTSNNNNNNSKRCRKCSKLHKSSMIYVLHEEVNDEDEFFIDFQKMCMLQKQRQNLKQWFSICWSNERCGKKIKALDEINDIYKKAFFVCAGSRLYDAINSCQKGLLRFVEKIINCSHNEFL